MVITRTIYSKWLGRISYKVCAIRKTDKKFRDDFYSGKKTCEDGRLTVNSTVENQSTIRTNGQSVQLEMKIKVK